MNSYAQVPDGNTSQDLRRYLRFSAIPSKFCLIYVLSNELFMSLQPFINVTCMFYDHYEKLLVWFLATVLNSFQYMSDMEGLHVLG